MITLAAGHADRPATPPSQTLALVRLLQLASPTLPLGAFSYSHGLEWAVEAGVVVDARGAGEWIGDALALSFGRCEAPVLVRLLARWRAGDAAGLRHWNAWFRASRDTAELRAETIAMGQALQRVLGELDLATPADRDCLDRCAPLTLPLVYALAATRWTIDSEAAVAAYTWTWVENQVMACLRCLPLGQAAGQRLLQRLGGMIPDVCARALTCSDGDLATFTPGLAIASCRHEVQYTRLFRS